jgi:hypothetical protein
MPPGDVGVAVCDIPLVQMSASLIGRLGSSVSVWCSNWRCRIKTRSVGDDPYCSDSPAPTDAKFADVANSLGCAMQFATDCRERALVLMDAAKQAPKFKDRLLAVSQLWLTLAALEDQINASVDQAHKLKLLH